MYAVLLVFSTLKLLEVSRGPGYCTSGWLYAVERNLAGCARRNLLQQRHNQHVYYPFASLQLAATPWNYPKTHLRLQVWCVLLLGNWVLVKSSCDSTEELWPLCKAAIYSADNLQCRLSSAVLPMGRKGRPLQQAGLHPVSLRECARELITIKNTLLLSKPTPLLLLLLCIREEKRTSSNLLSPPGLVLHSS